ncbi:MAG TPA: glucose-6-phosphate isomerase [Candidatus Binatia bacterium]|nr:glucose-6-phosphate isomerase [Candidatus Binatia bacterium]
MPDYRRRAARESMSVRLDVNGMMAEAIGPGESQTGLSRGEVDALAPRTLEVARLLHSRREAGELPFYELPQRREMATTVQAAAAAVRDGLDTLVVLGIGGSALGTRTLLDALGSSGPRVVVVDNIDPVTMGSLLDGLDLKRTMFNVVSKGGETAETMAQFLIVRERLLRELGAVDYQQRVIITTDAESGHLRQIVNDEGFRDLVVPAGVGGRFSVLTPVGLFPAAIAGVRIDELLLGAAWMDTRTRATEVWQNPAHLLATLLYLAETKHQRNVVVLMPYSDRLRRFADWFVQLWAESLGKAENLDGAPLHSGQTPVAALGATDQHSLLQLLIEGPHDKVVILLRVEDHGRELSIPSAYTDMEGVGYLGGNGLGALLNMEQRATELALVQQHRPVMTITVPQVNAFTLGQLFYLFEVATVFAGGLHRLDPLNQPGVEHGKRLTYGLAGRKGFEAQRAEVDNWMGRKRAEYVL